MRSQSQLRGHITQQIVAALEAGGLPPWKKPWRDDPNSGTHTSLSTGQAYRGINQLLLEISSMRHGYQSRWWGTYRQIQACGGNVRKGQKGTEVVLWKPISRQRVNQFGDEVEDNFLLMRSFHVWNCEQTDGLKEFRVGYARPKEDTTDCYEDADALVVATGADIRHGGNFASYDFFSDYIQMPFKHQFLKAADYYETLLHELIHWSEHPSRLNWSRSEHENTYALGELIAEMGACFVANELKIPNSDLGNHLAYLKTWLKAMKNDARFVFKAASQASRAADYLLSFSQVPLEEIPF